MARQKQEMLQIHKEILQILIEEHKQDASIFFTMRKTDRNNKLKEGYWFLGNDKYLQVSFWNGNDEFQKIARVGFFVEKRKEGWLSNVYLTCKDRPDLDPFFSDLSTKLGGFKPTSKHLWKKQYSSFNYLGNLKEFMNHDKVIIDEVIKNDRNSPISIIDQKVFCNNLEKVMNFRNQL